MSRPSLVIPNATKKKMIDSVPVPFDTCYSIVEGFASKSMNAFRSRTRSTQAPSSSRRWRSAGGSSSSWPPPPTWATFASGASSSRYRFIHSFKKRLLYLFIYLFIYFGSHHDGVRDWGTVTVVLLSVESMGNRQKSDPTVAGAADDEWQFIGLIGLSGGPIVQSVFTSQAVCVHNGTAVYLISEQQPRVAYRNQVRLGKIKKTNSNLKKYIRQGNRIHRH